MEEQWQVIDYSFNGADFDCMIWKSDSLVNECLLKKKRFIFLMNKAAYIKNKTLSLVIVVTKQKWDWKHTGKT